MKDIILDLERRYIPLKKCTGNKRTEPMWMSWKASRLIKRKHRLYAKYKTAEHPAYKSAAKEAKRELRRPRRKFEKQLAENIKMTRSPSMGMLGQREKYH